MRTQSMLGSPQKCNAVWGAPFLSLLYSDKCITMLCSYSSPPPLPSLSPPCFLLSPSLQIVPPLLLCVCWGEETCVCMRTYVSVPICQPETGAGCLSHSLPCLFIFMSVYMWYRCMHVSIGGHTGVGNMCICVETRG